MTNNLLSKLDQFIGTMAFHKLSPWHFNVVCTDGVKFLAKEAQAYWLIDAIASHQLTPNVKKEPFQVWELKKADSGNAATLTATDGNKKVLAKQEITYTDFPLSSIKFYLEQGEAGGKLVMVLMLTSER